MEASSSSPLLAQYAQMSVLKTAMQAQAQTALTLIEAVPSQAAQVVESGQLTPENLGNTIDVMA